MGIALWCEDEAGPFPTVPYTAPSWHPESRPQPQDHEYLRNGTAKVLTLFHPRDGQVRLKGVEQTTNAVLHPWFKAELTAILDTLPAVSASLSQAESNIPGSSGETTNSSLRRLWSCNSSVSGLKGNGYIQGK